MGGEAISKADPTSMIFTLPEAFNMIFDGLMSPCTIPLPCKASTALIDGIYRVMSEVTGAPIDALPKRVLRMRSAKVLDKYLGESDKRQDRFYDEVNQLADEPFIWEGREWHLPHSILATETRAVDADELAEAFKSSQHKTLARQMALALTRRPCGCVVWAPSGSGKGHLLRTTAHVLFHGGFVDAVRHLSAPRLTCGRVFPAERDAALAALLDELVDRPRLLLLLDHLDLGISATAASFSLLSEAFDRGARILATVQREEFLKDIREIPTVARRLLPVKVPPLNARETLKILKRFAKANDIDVAPAALVAAVETTERQARLMINNG